MSRRPLLSIAVGSVAAVVVLGYLLVRHESDQRPVVVLCAAALRPAMEATAAEYQQETGRRVEFSFGNSGDMLGRAAAGSGDLLLPADSSFVRLAEERGVVAETVPLARMYAVVLTRPGNPRGIARFDDLLDSALKLGQANPDAAAIGTLTRDHLRALGRWDALAAHTTVFHATVAEAANHVDVGGTDAAVVWDVVAAQSPGLAVVRLPELNAAVGRVELAVLRSAGAEAAGHFVRYVRAADRGQAHFRAAGFTDLEPASAWDGR